MDIDLSLSQDKVQQVATVCVAHLNAFVGELRRLFLVEDLIDSIKFGLLLWCCTYLGSWFNGMTLVIICKYFYYFYLIILENIFLGCGRYFLILFYFLSDSKLIFCFIIKFHAMIFI